nr:phosphate ABC transporter periplasmic phosphate-binding protein PstS [uncultured bacterium]
MFEKMTTANVLKTKKLWTLCAASTLVLGICLAGCNSGSETSDSGDANAASEPVKPSANLEGKISVDGSSTVAPITSAIVEKFTADNQGVQIPVGTSGTGGGFKKFGSGQLDISDASRPIKDKEAAAAKAKGVDFIELPIAYDGLSVVVNPKNTWAKSLTVAELKAIWQNGSKINNWSQVRKGFPSKPLKLYGPGTASGTFDYFVEEIIGKEGKSRSDYTASEDDNTLVEGVSRDEGALGYFGFAYYEENAAKLGLVGIDDGKGAVLPSSETILSGDYKPLSRPLFIYVSSKAADRPEIQAFVKFYLANAKELTKEVGYVPVPDSVYAAATKRFEEKTLGTVYKDKAAHGTPLEQLFKS